ncbi:hypothetical protein KP509_17G000400 [Ceratopteris richardii]|uniref:Uncharacterized protein n=1 Tax=Ceratopteris richardii TaxID=49495 RepID=A0A8T2SVB7_CERRI|nr:hypothetical protein KP509_17G000400 [Ceratopteris richardii]
MALPLSLFLLCCSGATMLSLPLSFPRCRKSLAATLCKGASTCKHWRPRRDRPSD